MQNTLLIGLSRQVALGRQLDVIANNIANLNTSAFKSDGALFEAYLSPTARAGDLSQKDSGLDFVRDRATWVDWGQGAMQRTGNPLDVAIEGKGFLTVQTANGERYTRNGDLQIDARGQLVTSAGDPVLGANGPIVFQKTDRGVTISKDGTISVRTAGSNQEAARGHLRIVSFQNANQLQKDGNSYYAAPKGVTPDPDKTSRIMQGAIEKSNVSPVLEMTHMIQVTRSYTETAEMIAKQANQQIAAIDKLAAVPN
ncbi:MAG: flagellar basal-body rod protein FlgF [Pseudolabrys sp.]|jgi:flagellar basal-body rod protein FlgF